MLGFAALQERYGNFYNPRFKIEVGSTTIDESDGRISNLKVDTAIERANQASFSLDQIFDHASREFTGVDFEVFTEGTTLDVEIGYGEETVHLFHGRIDSVRPNFPSSGNASLSVSAQDARKEMQSGQHHDSWDDTSITEVPSLLAENYDFQDVQIEGVDERLGGMEDVDRDKIVKPATSDYAYIEKLAENFGFETLSRAGTYYFRRPNWDAKPTLRLQWGRSLVSFQPGKPGGDQDVETAAVYGWDERNAEQIVGGAKKGADGIQSADVEEPDIEEDAPVESETEAEARAAAILLWTKEGPTSSGEAMGIPELQIGDSIEFGGLGEQYNGSYYVEQATHRIDSSGYTTSFEVREILE